MTYKAEYLVGHATETFEHSVSEIFKFKNDNDMTHILMISEGG